jgi:hypothetical protein
MFTITFVNLDHALRLVKLMTINKHMSGECPIFTNHVDKARIIKREVLPKELQEIVNLSKSRDGCCCLHQFESLFRDVQMKKMRYSEAPSSFHSNTSRTNEFEDPCKELWKKH